MNDNNLSPQERQEITAKNTGMGEYLEQLDEKSAVGDFPTGGDIDANLYQSQVDGEEAVGGETPTPDQDIVDEIGNSVGVPLYDKEDVAIKDKLDRRDDKRWELNPDSAEER